MQYHDTIDKMICDAGMTEYAVEKKRGKGNYLARSKSRQSVLKCDLVAQTAEICGYRMALVPMGSLNGDCLVIEPEQRG